MRDALGLTYSQLAGTMQAHVEGSVALPIQIAGAARAVITSIQLVKQKLSGPHEIMDGPFGYFTLFEPRGKPKKVFNTLGLISRVRELSHKPFPTGRAAHAMLDGLNILQKKHHIQSNNVKTITAQVPPLVKRLVDRPAKDNMTVNYARLCLQYLIAVQLAKGVIDTGSFTNDLLKDPAILASAKKVRIIEDDNPDPNALSPQKLLIES
jgi:2-methylcitrate dehydratase PrpD